jgi:hypothetical protein
MIQNTKSYALLTLAGTLPFVACAALLLAGIDWMPQIGRVDSVASSYGLAIVCFLTGTLWGSYLSGRYTGRLNLFILSNILFLATWFAFVGASLALAMGVQIIAFLVLLVIDHRLREGGVISAHYFRIRCVATVIAVFALMAILLSR